MAESLADKIVMKISQAVGLYYRLILVVAPMGTGKTTALQEVHRRIAAPIINVNLELSQRMLALTSRQRTLQLPQILGEILDMERNEIVLLDNTEVIFDVTLKQDPLRLLQRFSRNKTLVATWNGSISHDQIIYAEQNHSEYRRYQIRDFLAVNPEDAT